MIETKKVRHYDKQLGIYCSRTYLFCENCNAKKEIEAKKAKKFKGQGYKVDHHEWENCSWYEQK